MPIYDIEVYHDAQGNPQVRSSMMKLLALPDSDVLTAAIASIHAVILGDYLSGIDLLSSKYLSGVESAAETLHKQFELSTHRSNGEHSSFKNHPLATLAGKFSGSEWSETWEEVERTHNRLNAVEDLAG
jgi:hypothetical protein